MLDACFCWSVVYRRFNIMKVNLMDRMLIWVVVSSTRWWWQRLCFYSGDIFYWANDAPCIISWCLGKCHKHNNGHSKQVRYRGWPNTTRHTRQSYGVVARKVATTPTTKTNTQINCGYPNLHAIQTPTSITKQPHNPKEKLFRTCLVATHNLPCLRLCVCHTCGLPYIVIKLDCLVHH